MKNEIPEITNRKLLISLDEWNKRRLEGYKDLINLHENYILVICPKCSCALEEQRHVDTTTQPWGRQVCCLNETCKFVGYRLE